jgi:lipopolysaccharide export LptBFGC system permease protein LptF
MSTKPDLGDGTFPWFDPTCAHCPFAGVSPRRPPRRAVLVVIVTLAGAALILALSFVQAIEQHSLAPIWMAGWLPAILVASLSARSSRKHYSLRFWRVRQ